MYFKIYIKVDAESENDHDSVHDDFPAVPDENEGKASLAQNEEAAEKLVPDGLVTEQQPEADTERTETAGETMEDS